MIVRELPGGFIEREPLRLTFVSDLHLLSRRSTAQRERDKIAAAIDECDLCVWGGDLFDFCWSDRGLVAGIDFAIEYLEQWRVDFPKVRFAYLLGNHDCDRDFRNQLDAWVGSTPQCLEACDVLRIGSTVLTHGDVIERRGTAAGFARYRGHWSDKSPAPDWRKPIYTAAVAARVHTAVAATAHRDVVVCRKLARWSESHLPPPVQTMVFGHTHRQIDGRVVDGITFHNGGAAIRHVRFSPVQLVVAAR